MSVPDTLGYLAQDMTVFTRHSEYEAGSRLDERAAGIWLDAFERSFVAPDDIDRVLGRGQIAALVSPELHHKPHEDAWRVWRDTLATRSDDARVMLCTDLPDQAETYFTA